MGLCNYLLLFDEWHFLALKMSESFNNTLDYLRTRYDVRIEYNHIAYPMKSWAYDIYYVVSNGVEDIMGVYYLNYSKRHYISIETEPDYVESVFDTVNGFYRKQNTRKKHATLAAKFFYTDYDEVFNSIMTIGDVIDQCFQDELAFSGQTATEGLGNEDGFNLAEIEREELDAPEVEGADRETTVNAHVNQDYFRERLLQKNRECCLCGVNIPEFLVASHIKPWKDSSPAEKVDVDNGLLLCANHDRLFDSGYITFKDNGSIVVSNELDMHTRILMNVRPEMRIQVSERMKAYLSFHRKNIFRRTEEG